MRRAISTIAIGLTCVSGQALAQADQSRGASTGDSIDEIIVTAQRREQNLQTTPVAVTALSAEQLAGRGVGDLSGLVNVVPSLSMSAQTASQGGNAASFAIRGLGQQRDGNGTQPAVAIYIDDFYYPTIAGNLLAALDVSGIEVLRGPQGTLFGRNAVGGAIRYQTRKPDDQFGGTVAGTIGSYGRADLTGVINVPLGEKLAVRVTGARLERDGWQRRIIDNDRNGAMSDRLLRGQVRFRPVDDVTVDLSHEYTKSRLDGYTVYIPTIGVTPGPLVPTAFGRLYNFYADPDYTQAYASVSPKLAYGASPLSSDESRAHNTHLVVAADISDGLQLKLLSGRTIIRNIYANDADGTPLPVLLAIGDNRIANWSHELQAIGKSGALNYTIGVYHYIEKFSGHAGFVSYNLAGAIGSTAVNLNQRGSQSDSVYANISYDLSGRLTVTGGLRIGREEASAAVNNGVESNKHWSQFLPMLRAQMQWTPDVMSYIGISKGFRAGGYNILPTGALIPFGPETVWTGEAGMRLQTLNNRLRFNPTIFYTDYDNIQLQRIPAVGPPAPILENAGKAHIYGAELETQLNPLPGLSLTAAVSYLKAAYDKVNTTFITTATPLPRVPKWKVSLGTAYKLKLANGSSVDFNADYSYTAAQWGSDVDSNRLLLPSYSLVNGRITYHHKDSGWSIAGFVTNLTKEVYFNGALNFIPNAGNLTYNVGRPREFGVEMKVQF
ncbi:hypothetical protein CAF53_20505 [Sphingobium sp. LB126]|uniref:TonB-dependent receptor n=1 Tax=Sphingobium sp. LB126 TaxID=1983755 RepID=UPI000C1FE7EC|nr:TonB-dependent receptor [Sphingobium sp. LB126]PJG46543.1 hypothetical protein CAF53_20505 [Sphingobium sp. LB126]